jgi:hypothetical protein
MKSSVSDEERLARVEERLVRSFSQDEPPASARQLVATGLGIGAAGFAEVASASAHGLAHSAGAASKVGSLVFAKWVGIGVLAGTASFGAQYATRSSPDETALRSSAAISSAPTVARSVATADTIALPTPGLPETDEEPKPAPRQRALPHPVPGRVQTTTSLSEAKLEPAERTVEPGSPSSSTLAAETSLLDEARNAIGANDLATARSRLNRYAHQFPRGTLRVEADVLLIEALFLQGESTRAVAIAEDLLRSDPTSTHASRVRYLLSRHKKP